MGIPTKQQNAKRTESLGVFIRVYKAANISCNIDWR